MKVLALLAALMLPTGALPADPPGPGLSLIHI